MALIKCPRCELNYIQEEEKICSVCRREVRGESEQYDMIELCSECGEHPAVPGSELCAYCLKEHSRRGSDSSDDSMMGEGTTIEIDTSVSAMDEIELDLGGDMDGEVFAEDADFADEDLDEDSDDDN